MTVPFRYYRGPDKLLHGDSTLFRHTSQSPFPSRLETLHELCHVFTVHPSIHRYLEYIQPYLAVLVALYHQANIVGDNALFRLRVVLSLFPRDRIRVRTDDTV